ncbi:hypothetical protein HYV11_03095 [Candidatus Dependentiae bacterium]|nr:hypothetical protein [Candidatus Dependentiae bacterium]
MKKESLIYKLFLLHGLFLFFCDKKNIQARDVITTMKGIGSDFKSFGETLGSASFWKSIGRGFGVAPTGYVYSYAVSNDTPFTMYVDRIDMASFMGGIFPKAGGFHQAALSPYEQNYVVNQQEYYFEMYITQDKSEPTNRLPYMRTSALYVKDCISLPSPSEKNSTKINYFHIYLGKKIQYGKIVHVPMAEYLGYSNPSQPQDKNATIKKGNTLTGSPALVIYNSTNDDLLIGYSSKPQVKTLKKQDCDIFLTKILQSSFVEHDPVFGKVANQSNYLPVGTFGIFSNDSTQTTEVFSLPSSVFSGSTYTLEIFQDQGQDRTIGIQALNSDHDFPSTNRVRDITPVALVFWYKSVAQLKSFDAKGMVDLSGQLWVVSKGEDDTIQAQVLPGAAVQFFLQRPSIENKRWVYFLYVDVVKGDKKGKQFIDHFISGKIGADLLVSYEQKGASLFQKIQQDLNKVKVVSSHSHSNIAKAGEVEVPESLLSEALKGSLAINKGKLYDQELQINGYLLGADLFLPKGVGASSVMYYSLDPSSNQLPTSIVSNGFLHGQTTVSKGMPAPEIYNS